MNRYQRAMLRALMGKGRCIIKKRFGKTSMMRFLLNGTEYEVKAIPKRLKGLGGITYHE